MNKEVLRIAMQQAIDYTRLLRPRKPVSGSPLPQQICASHNQSMPHVSSKAHTGVCSTSTTRRVFMSFVFRSRWHCRFHADNLGKTPISRQFIFCEVQKIYDLARRGRGFTEKESRDAFDQAIKVGCGGVWLQLSEEQYSALVAASDKSPE